MMPETKWVYRGQDVTPERYAEIRMLAEKLKNDAEHDIEDKREIYMALSDLLQVARISYPEE